MNTVHEFQVPIEIRALKTANVYMVNGESNYLIDTGMSENSYKIINNSMDLKKIDFVIITHLHIDHIGGALYISKNYGIPVYISENDYNIIKHVTDNYNDYFKEYKNLMLQNGVPENLFNFIAEGNPMKYFIKYYDSLKLEIIDKLEIKNAKIIDVPGHSPGSIAIYLDDIKAMFTGDHVLKNISPNISVYSPEMDSLGMYLDSLRKIKNYNVNIAYPGHRDTFKDLSGRVDEIIKHHDSRIESILNSIEGKNTAFEISSSIEWSRGRKMESMNYMEKNFAIMETIAHLIYMENNGIVDRELEGNNYYYSRNK